MVSATCIQKAKLTVVTSKKAKIKGPVAFSYYCCGNIFACFVYLQKQHLGINLIVPSQYFTRNDIKGTKTIVKT